MLRYHVNFPGSPKWQSSYLSLGWISLSYFWICRYLYEYLWRFHLHIGLVIAGGKGYSERAPPVGEIREIWKLFLLCLNSGKATWLFHLMIVSADPFLMHTIYIHAILNGRERFVTDMYVHSTKCQPELWTWRQAAVILR